MCVLEYKIDIYQQDIHYFSFYTETQQKKSNVGITKFENRCVYDIYLIVLIPVFNLTYKQKKQVKKYI